MIDLPKKSNLELFAFAIATVSKLYEWGKDAYDDKELTTAEFQALFDQVVEPSIADFTDGKVKVNYNIEQSVDLDPQPINWRNYIFAVMKMVMSASQWHQEAMSDGEITSQEFEQFINNVVFASLNQTDGKYIMSFQMSVAE
ncbi:hypothetical protein [Candidatus Albibeggiatoa sp. nov. NOAA]|uniref:hypothetical protein n=1 Tax=Candidatus Albibeggiatoa sp. nov. NOAA TaxID=3162724 RepID=UPI0032FB5654|nr:hypothetical protein [Thiotrichaceae bacterium]